MQAGGLTATVAQYPSPSASSACRRARSRRPAAPCPPTIESPTALVTTDRAADAIAAFPQPFEEFDNPLTALIPAK